MSLSWTQLSLELRILVRLYAVQPRIKERFRRNHVYTLPKKVTDFVDSQRQGKSCKMKSKRFKETGSSFENLAPFPLVTADRCGRRCSKGRAKVRDQLFFEKINFEVQWSHD